MVLNWWVGGQKWVVGLFLVAKESGLLLKYSSFYGELKRFQKLKLWIYELKLQQFFFLVYNSLILIL